MKRIHSEWHLVFILVGSISCWILVLIFNTIWTAQMNGKAYDLNPDWSAKGQSIVFVCYRPSMEIKIDLIALIETKRYYGDIPYKPQDAEICSMASDGSNRKQLTHNQVQDDNPTWSPDGMQIAFISDRHEWSGLYIMNMDGSEQRKISHTEGIRDLAWSPDSKRIVFSSWDSIYILNIERNSERQLIQKSAKYLAWSPDGKTIAFIQEVSATGNNCQVQVIQTNNGDEVMSPIMAACKRTAWSPDSTRLAFVASESGGLLVTDLQMVETYVLTTNNKVVGSDLVWDPEGARIFYLTGGEISIAQVDGSGVTQITHLNGTVSGFQGSRNLGLSPDGKQLVFLRAEGREVPADRVKIWKMNSDGSDIRRLSP